MTWDEIFPPMSYDVNANFLKRQHKGKRTGAELWATALYRLRVLTKFRMRLMRKGRNTINASAGSAVGTSVVVSRFLRRRNMWEADDDDVNAFRRRIQQLEMQARWRPRPDTNPDTQLDTESGRAVEQLCGARGRRGRGCRDQGACRRPCLCAGCRLTGVCRVWRRLRRRRPVS
jgi:hypothetical protein